MDFTLYRLVIAQLAEAPDLQVIQQPHPCPEDWPLVLSRVERFRGQIQRFFVSDGETEVACTSTMIDVYDKITGLDLGAIIHLKGALPRFHEPDKRYQLEVDQVLTLKEYDEELKAEKAREAKRRAKLKAMMEEEGYFEFEGEEGKPAKKLNNSTVEKTADLEAPSERASISS